MKLHLAIALLCFAVSASAQSTAAKDILFAAFSRDAATSTCRSRIVFRQQDHDISYVIEKTDGRTRMTIDRGTDHSETIVIGQYLYTSAGTRWRKLPLAVHADPAISAPAFLARNLGDIHDAGPSPTPSLRFVGATLRWPAAWGTNDGTITYAINIAAGRLERADFSGTCAGAPCSFTQTFEYGIGLVINPPPVP